MILNINGVKELELAKQMLGIFFAVSLGKTAKITEDDSICEKNIFIDDSWAIVLLADGRLDVSKLEHIQAGETDPSDTDIKDLGTFNTAKEAVACVIHNLLKEEKEAFFEMWDNIESKEYV